MIISRELLHITLLIINTCSNCKYEAKTAFIKITIKMYFMLVKMLFIILILSIYVLVYSTCPSVTAIHVSKMISIFVNLCPFIFLLHNRMTILVYFDPRYRYLRSSLHRPIHVSICTNALKQGYGHVALDQGCDPKRS